ncbi:AAEL003478-PA [Aedes aegypti]|nr:AAEL003478-PA [Aedes aegypti]
MPWEAKADKSTVHWNQTRIMPISKLAVPQQSGGQKSSTGDRSQSTTPDSTWHSSVTSQDGLVEAIQLLSCRPIYRLPPMPPPSIGPPFVEEPCSGGPQQQLPQQNYAANPGLYGIWTQQNPPSAMLRQQSMQERGVPPFMQYIREQEGSLDENPPA